MKIAKIYRAAVAAKKHLLYLPLMALILCVAGCSDKNSPQEEQASAKLKSPGIATSTVSVFVAIDATLDDDCLYSTTEVQDELSSTFYDMAIDRGDVAGATITPIYSSDYVPGLASIINHIDWTGTAYESIADSLQSLGETEFSVPSICYYWVQFPNDSGCAIVSADKRKPTFLVYYNNNTNLQISDFDIEAQIYSLTDPFGDGLVHGLDSILLANWHSRVGLETTLKVVRRFFSEIAYETERGGWCSPTTITTYPFNILNGPLNGSSFAWGNKFPYISNIDGIIETNIPLVIVKLLAYEGYKGMLLDEYFDGEELRHGSACNDVGDWTTLIYNYLDTCSIETSYSGNGLALLEACDFHLNEPIYIPPVSSPNYNLWIPSTYLFPSQPHPGIVLVNGNVWYLLVGMSFKYDFCIPNHPYYSGILCVEEMCLDGTTSEECLSDLKEFVVFYDVNQ